MRLLVVAYACAGFGYVITATYLVLIVRDSDLGQTLEFVTWCVVGAFAACSPSLWNRVAGRRGERPALVAAHGVLAAGVMTTAFVPGTLGVLAGGALFGATFVGIVGVGVDLARRLHDLDPTRAIAVMTVAFAVGQMIGPAVGGWLADATGTFRVPSVVAAAVLLVGAAFLLPQWGHGAAPSDGRAVADAGSLELPPVEETDARGGAGAAGGDAAAEPGADRRVPRPRRRRRAGALLPPGGDRSGGLLVWLHGGGWVLGDLDSHDDPCRSLANRGGFCVLSVGYRLAPEHPFPAALDDAVAATRWAWDHAAELGCEPDDRRRRRLGRRQPGRGRRQPSAEPAVLPAPRLPGDRRCGWAHASIVENAEGYFLTAKGMRWFYDHYLSGDEGIAGRPACVAAAGGLGTVWRRRRRRSSSPPSTTRSATRAPSTPPASPTPACPTSHVRVDGQIHGFFSMFGVLDDARSAQAFAAEAVHTAFAAAESAELAPRPG